MRPARGCNGGRGALTGVPRCAGTGGSGFWTGAPLLHCTCPVPKDVSFGPIPIQTPPARFCGIRARTGCVFWMKTGPGVGFLTGAPLHPTPFPKPAPFAGPEMFPVPAAYSAVTVPARG